MPTKKEGRPIINKILAIPGITPSIIMRAMYECRKRQGICVNPRCNEAVVPGKARCAHHMEYARQLYRARHPGVSTEPI
jgi:hypothetical protein